MTLTGKLVTLVPAFHTDDLFDSSDEIERREVERLFVERTYHFDQAIFEQDHTDAAIWRMMKGRAILSRFDSNGEPSFVRIAGPNEVFGLTETLARIPCQTTLRAMSPCICGCMDQRSLIGLLHRRPRIRRRILELLADRYTAALATIAVARQVV